MGDSLFWDFSRDTSKDEGSEDMAEHEDDGLVDVRGIPRAVLIKALFDGAKCKVFGAAAAIQLASSGYSTPEAFWEHLASLKKVDYVLGRPIKVSFYGDFADSGLYNRDNGSGRLEAIVAELRLRFPLSKDSERGA